MFVRDSMSKKLITVDSEISVFTAHKIMKEHNIRHLPVINSEKKLVGIITDRDIRKSLTLSKEVNASSNVEVGAIMTPKPITISPSHTIQDALLILRDKKIGAFPVVDSNGTLKGILSVRDLLRAFTNILGIGEAGTLIGIIAEDKVGQLKKIVDTITEENISFASILITKSRDKKTRTIFPYLLTNNTTKIRKKLEKKGFLLIDPLKWSIDEHQNKMNDI